MASFTNYHNSVEAMKSSTKCVHLNRCVSLPPGRNNMLVWRCDKDQPPPDRGYQAGVQVTADKACLFCPPSECIAEFLTVHS